MSAQSILKYLRGATTILVILFAIFILFFLVTSVIGIVANTKLTNQDKGFSTSYEVMGFGIGRPGINNVAFYSTDSVVKVNDVKDHYLLEIKPRSSIGFFALLMQTISIGISFAILWMFMKLFKQTKLEKPFSPQVTKQLKTLALLFIISDVVKLIKYFSFGAFLSKSFTSLSMHFELLITVGSGIITGLIIWIIAVIFQRGIELQEENALTV